RARSELHSCATFFLDLLESAAGPVAPLAVPELQAGGLGEHGEARRIIRRGRQAVGPLAESREIGEELVLFISAVVSLVGKAVRLLDERGRVQRRHLVDRSTDDPRLEQVQSSVKARAMDR